MSSVFSGKVLNFLTWITDIESSSLGLWFIVISLQYFTVILWGFSHTTHLQTKMTNKSASKLSSALWWQGEIGRRAWSQVPEKKDHLKIVKFSVLYSQVVEGARSREQHWKSCKPSLTTGRARYFRQDFCKLCGLTWAQNIVPLKVCWNEEVLNNWLHLSD